MKTILILGLLLSGSACGMSCWNESELAWDNFSEAGPSTGGLGNLGELGKALPAQNEKIGEDVVLSMMNVSPESKERAANSTSSDRPPTPNSTDKKLVWINGVFGWQELPVKILFTPKELVEYFEQRKTEGAAMDMTSEGGGQHTAGPIRRRRKRTTTLRGIEDMGWSSAPYSLNNSLRRSKSVGSLSTSKVVEMAHSQTETFKNISPPDSVLAKFQELTLKSRTKE